MTERAVWKVNGFLALAIAVLFFILTIFSIIAGRIFIPVVTLLLFAFFASGIKIVQPNEAKALIFFGRYLGSIRESGLWLTIPFSMYKKVSLKVRNFNSVRLKVNDIEGNPVEIAAVVVFRVVDSAKAVFDVDDYEKFVEIQAETALRHVASKYPYDNYEADVCSLRGSADLVASEIASELQARLAVAGLEVMEARLTHLAYATEIASAMLQRQQASAILAARQKIVEGAVGIAQMAIEKLQQEGTVKLDEERKVAMINNLLVTIVSDRSAQPVINTGSLSQ